jgi:predicted RNA-binding Zn-ribbon protein involved in translation (DUF1610 family)
MRQIDQCSNHAGNAKRSGMGLGMVPELMREPELSDFSRGRLRNAQLRRHVRERKKKAVVAVEVLGELVNCAWYRVFCPRCGEYDVAKVPERRDLITLETCKHCGKDDATVQATAKGATRHALPYVSKTRKVMADWLKRGNRGHRKATGRPKKTTVVNNEKAYTFVDQDDDGGFD